MKKEDIQQKALNYYNMGLNSKEISKLLDTSFRTIQNWIFNGNWKQNRNPSNLKLLALKLSKSGYTQKQIAKRMNRTAQTVYLWLKELET